MKHAISFICFFLFASATLAAPTTQQSAWFQQVGDNAPQGTSQITAKFTGGDVLVRSYIPATMPVVVPPPMPPVAKRIVQPSNVFAVQADKPRTISDTVVTQGGIVRATYGNDVKLYRVHSEGAPSGIAIYAALVATKPCNFLWDNTGDDWWITNGQEAALRVMGGAKTVEIIGVKFVNRLHDTSDGGLAGIMDPTKVKLAPVPQLYPTLVQPKPPLLKKYAPWKQVCQWRDVRNGHMKACLVVGIVDIGQQAAPGAPQHVDNLLIENCGLSNEFHFTDAHSYGTVIRKGCWQIDDAGNPKRDASGRTMLWADATWKGK